MQDPAVDQISFEQGATVTIFHETSETSVQESVHITELQNDAGPEAGMW